MHENVELMRQSNSKQLAQLKKWQKVWDSLAKELVAEKPDPPMLKLYISQLSGWVEAFGMYSGEWAAFESSIAEMYQDMVRHYESDLRKECSQHRLVVDGEFPRLTIDGLIEVKIDKEDNKVFVNGKRTTCLSLKAVLELIQEENKRLWGRQFDSAKFYRKLLVTYTAVRKKKAIPEGEYVALLDVHQELNAKNAKYILDLFSADLSRLIESKTALDLSPVRDPRQAVYIYDRSAHSGRYLGLLRFKKG